MACAHDFETWCPECIAGVVQQLNRVTAELHQLKTATPAPDDAALAYMLLGHLWTVYDSGGISDGRSWESSLLEPARALLDPYRPAGDRADWPPVTELLARARERVRAINRKAARPRRR